MSGRLSLAEREALARQDARFLPPLQVADDRTAMLVHARHTARLLTDQQAASPSALAVAHVNAMFQRSIPEPWKKLLACRQGCAHCCYQPVILLAPELFFLAGHIRGRPGMTEKLREAAKEPPGLAQGTPVPCPILENDACSAYAARPLSCHAYVSVNVNDCISTFRYLKEQPVRSPQDYSTFRNSCRIILASAAKAAGLPLHWYQLDSQALAVVLAQDDAEKRWMRGEDVLGSLPTVPPAMPPEFAALIDDLAAAVAPAL